jgi:hypothetical protein
MSNLYSLNVAKLTELLPNCQARALKWMDDAFSRGWEFRVSESFRTQERQNELYKIGRRGKQGEKPVTYTRASKHTQRTAIDVYPSTLPEMSSAKARNLRLIELENLGVKYGIYRPAETRAFGDFVHYQVHDVPLPVESPEIVKRREERQQKLQNAIISLKRDALAQQASVSPQPRKSRLIKRLISSPSL